MDFGEAAVLLYTTGSGSDLRWNNFSFTSPTSPINVLRPAETLSIQIWNLQTNGQDRALANLSSAVLMILVLAFSIGANVWSRHISKKTSWIREIERLRMNNKFTVNDLNLYYGDFHALKKYKFGYQRKKKLQHSLVLVDVVNQHF